MTAWIGRTDGASGTSPDLAFSGNRSPVLAKMPASPRVRRQYLLRWIAVGVPAIIVMLLVVVVYTRLLSETGAGWPLYWFHDNIFLPIRGNLWTWGFPFNLLWWVPLLGMAAIGITGFLSGLSIVRLSQRTLIKMLAARPAGGLVLSEWHRMAGRGWLRARFIEEVIESEYEAAFNALRAAKLTNQPSSALASRAVIFSSLRTTLRIRYATPGDSVGFTVQAFADSLLIASPPNPTRELAKSLQDQCAGLIGKIANGIFANDNPKFALDDGFSLSGLAAEARDLLTQGTGETPGGQAHPPGAGLLRRRIMLTRLAADAENRHDGSGAVAATHKFEPPPTPGAAAAIAVLLAVDAAMHHDSEAENTAAFLGEADRLRFAVAMGPGQSDTACGLLAAEFAAAETLIDTAYVAAALEIVVTQNRRRVRRPDDLIRVMLATASADEPGLVRDQIEWRNRGYVVGAAIDEEDVS